MAQNRDDGFGRYRDDDGRPWEGEPADTDDSYDDEPVRLRGQPHAAMA